MSKYYFELSIKPDNQFELFLDLIESLVDDAIEENDGVIIIRSEESLEDIKDGVLQFSEALNIKCEISHEEKENIDWIKEYQNSIKAVEVGSFYIRPSWLEAIDGKIDIIIDPALAFGSGHHETTSSCLEAIDEFVKKDDTLLDVGTGSGILAIASAKKGAVVDICDTDEVCLISTKSNFELNSSKFNNFWIGSVNSTKNTYDVVVANIVADVLLMIASDLKKVLKSNAKLILSGILDKHEDKILKKFNDLKLETRIHKNEWVTLVFTNNKES